MLQSQKIKSEKSDKSIVLLGGAGYIGPVIAQFLLEYGYQVIVYDNLLYKHHLSTAGLFLHEKFSFVFGDLSDTEKVEETCKGASAVIILGGLVGDPITKK